MLKDVTFSNCRIWRDHSFEKGKIALEKDRIVEVGEFKDKGQVIDLKGLCVFPALIDNHVHFRSPGAEEKEDFESGSRAAAHGGVGAVLEVQNCAPLLSTRELLDKKLAIIQEKSLINVGVYASAVPEVLDHLEAMKPQIAGLKLFMAPSHGDNGLAGKETMSPFFKAAADLGVTLIVHAEDGGIVGEATKKYQGKGPAYFSKMRPPEAEIEAVKTALDLAQKHGTDLHVFHITTKEAVDLICEARKNRVKVTGSTCPHYLFFTEGDLKTKGALLKVNPSIKGVEDQQRILEGLRKDEIQIVSTDHAPHKPHEKTLDFNKVPAGISSADLLLPLMLTLVANKELTFQDLVRLCVQNPAKIHHLSSCRSISPGQKADLTVFDPEEEWVVGSEDLLSKAKLSPYVGLKLSGRVKATLVNGRFAYGDLMGL